jgi:hypothetical protein
MLIDHAETMFGQLPSGEVDNTALGFTERQFWFTVGTVYTNLGLPREAAEAQQRALALYQPTEYLDPALIRLDQATCLVHSDQADAACELAVTTITSAPEQHRSGLIIHYGREFYGALPAPARALPAARQLYGVLTPRLLLNRVVQGANAFDGYRYLVAWFNLADTSGCASEYHVVWQQRHRRGNMSDELADIPQHVTRVTVLAQFIIDRTGDTQSGRVKIRGDPWAEWTEGVKGFGVARQSLRALDIASGDIVGARVSEDIGQGVLSRRAPAFTPDNYRQFGLIVNFLTLRRVPNGLATADKA